MTAYTYAMEGAHDEVEAAARHRAQRRRAPRHRDGEGDEGLSGLYDAIACMDHPVGDAIVAADVSSVPGRGPGSQGGADGRGCRRDIRRLRALRRAAQSWPDWRGSCPSPIVWPAAWATLPLALLNHFFDYQASLGRLGRQKLVKMVERIHDPRAIYRLASSVIDDDDIETAAHLGSSSREAPIELSLPDLMLDTVKTWLPYQILNKMDQLSMIHGLEARVPFLDPRIYDHLVTAPDSVFLEGRENKVLLRRVLERADGVNAPAAEVRASTCRSRSAIVTNWSRSAMNGWVTT